MNVNAPKVKICCISSVEEAMLAIEYGASAIGLVSHMPSGPGIISNQMIKAITESIPDGISVFLLTSKTSAIEIIDQHRQLNIDTIQLVDKVDINQYEQLRVALPHVKLVQVIHVQDEKAVEEAIRYAQLADVILLDSGNPHLDIKVLGGTARVHNWDISKRIISAIDVPVYLAGGLKSSNVSQAIEKVQPYGVDLCSGVRTDGKLDREKLEAFFQAVNSNPNKTT
jgi:phosphoribosylanthranilate isomerase